MLFLSSKGNEGEVQEKKTTTRNINRRSFDSSTWKDLNKEYQYDDEKKPDINPKRTSKSSKAFKINNVYVKSIFFILAIVLLVFVLFKFLATSGPKNTSVPKLEFTFENIEDSIHEANLEDFLNTATANNNLPQIIRVYYLIILRELSSKNWILWKKDKTNSEYLREMRNRESYTIFQELTYFFELAWYSEKQLPQEQYPIIINQFKDFINTLSKIRSKGEAIDKSEVAQQE